MKQRMTRATLIIAAVIIAILLVVIGILGWKYDQARKATKEQTNSAQETSKRVIKKVGSLYLIPTNEEPTVALIQDKKKLGNQEFFKNARNGDYLLVYQKNKIALVYREDSNKLVNVGPVNIGEDTGQTAGAQTETQPDTNDESKTR